MMKRLVVMRGRVEAKLMVLTRILLIVTKVLVRPVPPMMMLLRLLLHLGMRRGVVGQRRHRPPRPPHR